MAPSIDKTILDYLLVRKGWDGGGGLLMNHGVQSCVHFEYNILDTDRRLSL
jgi:hypothetical protein